MKFIEDQNTSSTERGSDMLGECALWHWFTSLVFILQPFCWHMQEHFQLTLYKNCTLCMFLWKQESQWSSVQNYFEISL